MSAVVIQRDGSGQILNVIGPFKASSDAERRAKFLNLTARGTSCYVMPLRRPV